MFVLCLGKILLKYFLYYHVSVIVKCWLRYFQNRNLWFNNVSACILICGSFVVSIFCVGVMCGRMSCGIHKLCNFLLCCVACMFDCLVWVPIVVLILYSLTNCVNYRCGIYFLCSKLFLEETKEQNVEGGGGIAVFVLSSYTITR